MEKNNRVRAGRLWIAALVCIAVGGLRSMAQEIPAPVYPVEVYKKNDKGILVVEVGYDVQGKVAACRVVRSNAPYPLEATTVNQIKTKWTNDFFAGSTQTFSITFDQLPSYVTHWDANMVTPLNLLPQGDPGRTLKLRLTFDKDGWVQHVQVIQPSGIELVDRETAIWVTVHWHNDAFAGQTMDAPFEFKTPPLPKVVAAPLPPKVKTKPQPKAPEVPEEPAATPAVRVQ